MRSHSQANGNRTWINQSITCRYTKSNLSIHLVMVIWVVSSLIWWLLQRRDYEHWVYVFVCGYIFSLLSNIQESNGWSSSRYIFNFLRNRLFLNMVLSSYISTLALCKSSNSFINSPALLSFSHSDMCLVVLCHGGF